MGLFGSLFGGLNDGKPGMFSQLDGSNSLERALKQLTGSPAPPAADQITVGQLPPATSAPPAAATGTAAPAAATAPNPQVAKGMFGSQAPKPTKHSIFDHILYGSKNLLERDELNAQRAQVEQAFADDPQALAIFRAAGPSGLNAYLNDKRDRTRPTIVNTKGGIVAVTPKDGGGFGTETIFEAPNHGQEASPGWQMSPDGKSWQPVPGGPYDPDYIARTAGIRRDAVVDRPMPRTGGGGRGRSARPKSYSADQVSW